jgi:ribulose-phosphate 3-epimerase
MFERVQISPSILSADLCNLEREIKAVESAGAHMIHVDVMDGHFVNNLTFGLPLIKRLKEITKLPLDVHLMISNPLETVENYVNAGSDIITVHAEAATSEELVRIARIIHTANKKAGVAIRPSSKTEILDDVISAFDMVLVMSVEPGFSGQKFQAKTIDLMAEVCAIAAAHNTSPLMQADGGIGVGTAQKVCASGADVLVCGNACFCADDKSKAINAIKLDAESGRQSGLKKQKFLENFM